MLVLYGRSRMATENACFVASNRCEVVSQLSKATIRFNQKSQRCESLLRRIFAIVRILLARHLG